MRITRPREMARLQGVPDALPVPSSEQAANSLFGNAVCVDVTRGIFESLFLRGARHSLRRYSLVSWRTRLASQRPPYRQRGALNTKSRRAQRAGAPRYSPIDRSMRQRRVTCRVACCSRGARRGNGPPETIRWCSPLALLLC